MNKVCSHCGGSVEKEYIIEYTPNRSITHVTKNSINFDCKQANIALASLVEIRKETGYWYCVDCELMYKFKEEEK